MRTIQTCTHFWQVQGNKGQRWFDGHAMARCVHCQARTTVEYGTGVGPCPHTVGVWEGGTLVDEATLFADPPPAPTGLDPSYATCDDCLDLIEITPVGEEIPLCPTHAKTPSGY